MNRAGTEDFCNFFGMPHVGGDEPSFDFVHLVYVVVCPTYVGMNHCMVSKSAISIGMPHVRGDELRWVY